MNAQLLSRRAALAGLATLSAATAAIALPQTPDPIFAVIEKHHAALLVRMDKWRIVTNTNDDAPEYEGRSQIEMAATTAHVAAQHELIGIIPTTMAGVLALLTHLEEFHLQQIALPDDAKNWHSQPELHSENFTADSLSDRFSGKPLELPFTFWILANVREALEEIADPHSTV